MNPLSQVEQLLPLLSASEKATLLGLVSAQTEGPWQGIEKTPGVCGGQACVVRTRIPVWLLERFRREGASDQELLLNYPSLNPQDLENARRYAASYSREIDEAIEANDQA